MSTPRELRIWLLVPVLYLAGKAAEKGYQALAGLIGSQGGGWPNALGDSRPVLAAKHHATSSLEAICRVQHPECWSFEMIGYRVD